ncbi:hypothetical protein OXYTRIMIC_349 [Oxytricha trifallax]|uniref:Uncharacterized protein n=1 Tax=Oxytricha trifallax TaxID=1172189 RepID=A0A073I0R8_9SPIT|nr:hypothetical protein OXYTRIMIC_349 [Oxytricha trifallax]
MSCQGLIKKCRNQLVVKTERGSKKLEIYDSRKSVGSLAIVQKHLRQISEFSEGTIGKEFRVSKIESKSETNQVKDPENFGVMAILIVNHLALELPGEAVFQIFAKDWINGQRYYAIFLPRKIGHMKMEILKSGMALEEEKVARETERKNVMIWQKADEEMGTSVFNSHIDNWDEDIIRGSQGLQMDKEDLELEERYSQMVNEFSEAEGYLFNKMRLSHKIVDEVEQMEKSEDQGRIKKGNSAIMQNQEKTHESSTGKGADKLKRTKEQETK